ncbi:MAG: helix-turn-helix transcriptional regulator [Candidatus Contendobacter sp.]|nr:helix-turn-helix transcriptional regulator [Candidatus Contendobacter sp.]
MTNDERIGHKITVRRAVLRMNQAELARRAGVAQSYISMIENGERPLTDELLQRIVAALDCKPEHLLREFQDVA